MKSFSKKFSVQANENILVIPEILEGLRIKMGQAYKDNLVNGKTVTLSFDIFFDAEVQVEFVGEVGSETVIEDIIGGKVYPVVKDAVSKILPKSACTGLIFFKNPYF